jgi:type IV pilus assembly protein PilY1
MSRYPQFKLSVLGGLAAAAFAAPHVHADPLDLSRLPPGLVAIPPTPDVVLTVDDSGSMGEKVGGGDNNSKIFRLKEALNLVFNDKVLLPDGKIRLAWQSMWNNGGSPGAGSLTPGAVNSMKVLDATHRTNFLAFANSLTANNGTPSHKMLKQVYDYMRTGEGINSPWAYTPGVTEKPYLGCRRAYHIFLTDGAWNGQNAAVHPGEVDNVTTTLPDGTVYDTASAQTNVYKGALGNTLADWAMKLWREDLQTTIADDIKPSTTDGVPTTETVGGVPLQRYWNPKHNPAKWQHVVQYTIGYGKDAYSWPSAPTWSSADDDNYGGDYSKLVNGTVVWVPTVFANLNANNPAELWHMAINSRGKFYPTGPGRKHDLQEAFRKIVEDINLQNTADVSSLAASSTTNQRSDLASFTAGYDPKRWSGYVKSNTIDTSGNVTTNSAWGTTGGGAPNTTATLLDTVSVPGRVVLTTNSDLPNKGVSFEWETGTTKLSTAQKAILDFDGKGEDRVNYLRGDRSKEGGTATAPFRIRDSIQGDIVNSNIWYTGAPASNYSFGGYAAFAKLHRNRLPMLYVGGNDGMLHGFSATTGVEKIAYVPKAVIPDLVKLSDPAYKHRYFVDGSPLTGDANVGTAPTVDWRTLLVGTLGAGGKGYFVLDVTQPGNKSGTVPSNFNTGNAAALVLMDRTLNAAEPLTAGTDDEDIGHIFAAPVMDDSNPYKTTQIARLNDDRWAVVMGNGYNSKNERPVLLIQYLDEKNKVGNVRELRRIVATGTQALHSPVDPVLDADIVGNGLSAPRLLDVNGDGRVDVAYAGDLKGNLWKFDLTSTDANVWGVAVWGSASVTPCKTGTCKPLFTAVHAATGKRQAITTPPSLRPNNRGVGGLMVAFGTGANITDDQRSSTDVHSVYSVLDNTKYKLVSGGHVAINTTLTANPDGIGAIPVAVAFSELVQQDMVSTSPLAGAGLSAGRDFWKMTQNKVNFSSTGADPNKKGWYFNFQVTGERVLKAMSFFDGTNNLAITSVTPAYGGNGSSQESCEPAGTPEKQYITLMNIMDGRSPSFQVMDRNGDGLYNNVAGKDDGVSRMSLPPGAIGAVTGKKVITITGVDGKKNDFARAPEQALRPSWRQLQ